MAKRRFGDRKDARRVRDITGMMQISCDLKPNRSVSDVYINQKMDMTKLMEYMDKMKKKNPDITFFHAIVAAVGKVFYNRPKLNYFVANRHIYEHNDVVVSFVAKMEFSDKAEEMMILVKIDPEDTLETVSKKIKDQVEYLRGDNYKKENANGAIDVLAKLPNPIRIPVVGLLKWLDKHGKLPKGLRENIYYSSIILSNLGSIKCGAIFHNINDFGCCSSLATMGEVKDEEVMINGKKETRKLCEFGINLDERIADGYYFAKSIKVLQHIFDNPKLLEERADAKIETSEIR